MDTAQHSASLKKEVFSLGKNSLIYMIGQALSRTVGFVMIPVYTRYIAPANYGAMEIIEILSSVLLLTITIGASDGLSSFYYSERDEGRRNVVVSTVIVGFAIFAVPIVVFTWFFGDAISALILDDSSYGFILRLSFVTCWFGMLCDMGYTYLRMLYKAKLFVLLTLIQLFSALSLNIFFVVHLELNILGIFYSTLISQAVVGLLLVVGVLRNVGVATSLPLLGQIIKFGLPIVPSRIGIMLGFVSNRFFLRWLLPVDPATALAQIGLFSLGHKFGVVVNRFVTSPLASFWAPRRMELLLAGESDSRETVARICSYSTFCSIFAGLFLSASVSSLIEIMADPSYEGAENVVPFVVLSYIALGLEGHFVTGILYSRKTRLTTYITLVSLAVVIAWNVVFIPSYGLVGAATSNVAGYVVRLFLTYRCSQLLYPIPYECRRLGLMLLTATLLYLLSQLIVMQSAYLNILARTAVVATFPVLFYFIGGVREDERAVLLKGIQKVCSFLKLRPGFPR